jgi:hypothetical protein
MTYPHNHPKFDSDEKGLLIAANIIYRDSGLLEKIAESPRCQR